MKKNLPVADFITILENSGNRDISLRYKEHYISVDKPMLMLTLPKWAKSVIVEDDTSNIIFIHDIIFNNN